MPERQAVKEATRFSFLEPDNSLQIIAVKEDPQKTLINERVFTHLHISQIILKSKGDALF